MPSPFLSPSTWVLAALGLTGSAVAAAGASPDLAPLLAGSGGLSPLDWPRPLLGLALFLATFVSEDLTCIGAGLLVAGGAAGFGEAVLACLLGIVAGDMGLYAAGRWLGAPALRRAPLRWFISRGTLAQARRFYQRHGGWVVLGSRFLPGTRAATYFTAGVARAPAGRFFLLFLLAAGLWTPLLVGLAWQLGERVAGAYAWLETLALPAALAAGLALYGFFQVILPLGSWRGRRLLLGRWRRLVRWEFWPLWQIQAPVFCHVLWLGFGRYRRPTLFTLANPAIPTGGFIGESKSAILRGLSPDQPVLRPEENGVARWGLVPAGTPGERTARAREILRELGLDFPVVLKPDEGQRGLAVKVVRDPEALSRWVNRLPGPLVLQEFVPGCEFGIFYYRFPEEARGRLFSITEKRLPRLRGDGRRTLEELILADDRAVCQAQLHLDRWADRLGEVVPAGQEFPLVEIGNHARGTLFLDGRHHLTPALEEAVDRLARAFPGFHFGRFDVRVPSVEDLRAGRGLRVLELNGVSSEATHIYHPGFSLGKGWTTLFEQWRLAFAIGAAHARQGLSPMPPLAFLRAWARADHRQSALGEAEVPAAES